MPSGYTEMGRDAAARVATILASAGKPIPAPSLPTPIFCTAGTVDGRTQASLEESIALSWNSSSHFAEVGQKNKVYDANNVLIGQTNSVVSWGKSPGAKLFSAVSLSKDLTPILLMTEKVRVDYEVHGGTSSSWQKCGKTVSMTWTRPPVSYGQCVIPDGYQTTCGGANVKVFRGGVCQVQKGPVAAEIGKIALCNGNLSWEFVPSL
jgi:hypothetical protein